MLKIVGKVQEGAFTRCISILVPMSIYAGSFENYKHSGTFWYIACLVKNWVQVASINRPLFLVVVTLPLPENTNSISGEDCRKKVVIILSKCFENIKS